MESARPYVRVFLALMILAAATALIALVDLGHFNVTAALGIALVKSALVATYFMHVRESPRLIWLVAFAALAWLGILLALTLADYATRSWQLGG